MAWNPWQRKVSRWKKIISDFGVETAENPWQRKVTEGQNGFGTWTQCTKLKGLIPDSPRTHLKSIVKANCSDGQPEWKTPGTNLTLAWTQPKILGTRCMWWLDIDYLSKVMDGPECFVGSWRVLKDLEGSCKILKGLAWPWMDYQDFGGSWKIL